MTDISGIVPESRTIDIKHPATDAKLGLSITLLPETHPRVREVVRKQLNDRLLGRNKLDAAQIESNRAELLTAAADGWAWGQDDRGEEATFEGEKPAFTPAAFNKVLKKLPWIRDQIDRELGDSAAFFRGPEEEAD